jgi:hypothetical protein
MPSPQAGSQSLSEYESQLGKQQPSLLTQVSMGSSSTQKALQLLGLPTMYEGEQASFVEQLVGQSPSQLSPALSLSTPSPQAAKVQSALQ